MHQEIKTTGIWLILAFLLTFAGFWQAKIAVARDAEASHRFLPPPAKTKHFTRPTPAVFTGNPIDDYITRCERGMTNQEIQWILEDFKQSGLTQRHPWDDMFNDQRPNPSPSPAELESFLAYTRAQTYWYRDILRDGFRLSPEQYAELSRNLTLYLEKSQATFLGWVRNGFPDEQTRGITTWGDLYYLDWGDGFPWNLCTLTSSQQKICWKTWCEKVIEKGEYPPKDDLIAENELKPSAGDPGLSFLHVTPGGPDGAPIIAFDLTRGGERIFRHLKNQKFPSDGDQLQDLRRLHPAQLKTVLLFNSSAASLIQDALEEAAEKP